MATERTKQLLGELLTEAGLLQIDDLREAANIARSQDLPIGKVLVMSGYISKELLKAAIEMQSRLKDNLLDYDIGINALKLVDSKDISLDEALLKLNAPMRPMDSTKHRLGALLLDAAIISKNDFDKALEESQNFGLPLGRVLCNLSIVSESIIGAALKLQKMLRSGEISKDNAVKSLVEVKKGKVNQENSISPQTNSLTALLPKVETDIKSEIPNIQAQELSLHHMLRMAGLVQTEELEKAIRQSLENPEVMTFILKQSGLLEEFVIEAAKECCQLVASGAVKPEQAIIALHQCQRTRTSVKGCLEEFGWIQKSKVSLKGLVSNL